jgi:hypothetical protein
MNKKYFAVLTDNIERTREKLVNTIPSSFIKGKLKSSLLLFDDSVAIIATSKDYKIKFQGCTLSSIEFMDYFSHVDEEMIKYLKAHITKNAPIKYMILI